MRCFQNELHHRRIFSAKWYYTSLAGLHVLENRYDEAVILLKQLLEFEPLHPLALTTLAPYYISEGQELEAREIMRKIGIQAKVSKSDSDKLLKQFQKKFKKTP